MKKLTICLLTVAALFLFSCNKNPAEKYVGTYALTTSENYHLAGFDKNSDKFTNHVTGTMTIRLAGDDGQVVVEGDVFNTTGYVDQNGILHLDNETHASNGGDINLFGHDIVGVEVSTDMTHNSMSLINETLTWTSDGAGSFQAYLGSIPLVGGMAEASFSNTAVRQ